MYVDTDHIELPWNQWLEPHDYLLCSHMTAEPRALLASLAKATLPPGLTVDLSVPFSLDAQMSGEVTLDEALADVVVTEHGVASLRDASATQRRERMIAIADPAVRDSLINHAN